MINTPNNPTGSVMTRRRWRRSPRLAVAYDTLMVISDDVTTAPALRRRRAALHRVFPGHEERTVIVNGFSKVYAMTGWRISCRGPGGRRPHDQMPGELQRLRQCARPVRLEGCQDAERRRSILLDGLAQIDGIRCSHPNSAFCVFADISSFGLSSVAVLQPPALTSRKVVCIPGSAFGECGEGFIRIAYTCSG